MADGREVLHALLLDPAAGPVTLDEQVSAAVREIAQVTGEGTEQIVPGADVSGGRITLSPRAGEQAVSVVSLPLC